jgi:hypothetical protein
LPPSQGHLSVFRGAHGVIRPSKDLDPLQALGGRWSTS